MTLDDIADTLAQLFGDAVTVLGSGSWQVEAADFRLLVLLSEDLSWLRLLIPIAPAQEAMAFLPQLLEANFDDTQAARYALRQGVLWCVFQHSRTSLSPADFISTIQRLLLMKQHGLDDSFSQLVEQRVRQIVQTAKQQGQSLEATMQTLDRFYEEGVMGEEAGPETRQATLAAWRYQLERLWNEVE
jgi:hypothetical protein